MKHQWNAGNKAGNNKQMIGRIPTNKIEEMTKQITGK